MQFLEPPRKMKIAQVQEIGRNYKKNWEDLKTVLLIERGGGGGGGGCRDHFWFVLLGGS